jgi:glycosyltransferase 2 family protein
MKYRRLLFILAKASIAAVILWWLLRRTNLSLIWQDVRGANRQDLVLGVLLVGLTVVIAGWRWQQWLSIFDIRIALARLIAIAQIGQFFLMFLPGPAGDDLTRMLYISRIAKDRIGQACLTVVLDRCAGLASILLLAAACLPVRWKVLASTPQTHFLLLGMMLGGGMLVLFAAVLLLSRKPAGPEATARLSSLKSQGLLERMRTIWLLLAAHKPNIIRIGAAAIGTQLVLCLVFAIAGHAIGLTLPISIWLTSIPIVLAANAVPITIAGLGVREYLLVLLLGVTAGVDAERAVATSLIAFSMMLAVCLFGGVVYIIYRPGRGRKGRGSRDAGLSADLVDDELGKGDRAGPTG